MFLVTPERLVICISEFRCWCSVSMLTTACRSLTARTEHHTLSVYFRQFLNLLGNPYRGFKKNNNTNICKAHIVSIRAESEAPSISS